MDKILVIAAHPDDELLGCGGTIAKLTKQGSEVRTIIACEGESVRFTGKNVMQYDYTEKAAEILGIKRIYRLNFSDQRLDRYDLIDIIQPIEKVIDEMLPNIVFIHFGGDSNQDHKRIFEASLVAVRPTNESIREVFAFYTASSTEWGFPRNFTPDTFVDISEFIDIKIKAFSCYESEINKFPHPRSIEALKNTAMFFGNQCCLTYAEPFVTVRRIIREHR